MSYSVQQFDAVFAIKKGKEEEALAAVKAKEGLGLYDDDDLARAFSEFGWDWFASQDESADELYRNESKLSSTTGEFLDTLAPFVEEGSYITLIGEDLNIFRYYFKGGECLEQSGDVTFEDGTPVPVKNGKSEWTPPGVEENEAFFDTVNGEKVVFPSASVEPDGASYVRIVDERGVELVLWDSAEWHVDSEGVMGALMGAILHGAAKD